jgi:hypothetical protein
VGGSMFKRKKKKQVEEVIIDVEKDVMIDDEVVEIIENKNVDKSNISFEEFNPHEVEEVYVEPVTENQKKNLLRLPKRLLKKTQKRRKTLMNFSVKTIRPQKNLKNKTKRRKRKRRNVKIETYKT